MISTVHIQLSYSAGSAFNFVPFRMQLASYDKRAFLHKILSYYGV